MSMKQKVVLVLIVAGVSASQAPGSIVTGDYIIAAPSSVNNEVSWSYDIGGGVSNTHQEGFNEKQNVLLTVSLSVDDGTISADTRVDSHMIFFNWIDSTGPVSDGPRDWVFSGVILGVMSDEGGALEVASSSLLGASYTIYPSTAYQYRGIETGTTGNDSYSVDGSTLTFSAGGNLPGDWIRVITLVPEPTTLFVMTAAGLPLLLKRKRKSR